MKQSALPGSRLPGKELAVLLGTSFVLLFATMPAETYPGDPFAFREEARNLLLRGSLDVGSGVQMPSAPGQYFVRNPRNGGYYSKYGVMNGLMSLPPLVIERLLNGELPSLVGKHRLLLLNLYNLVLSLLIAGWLLRIVAEYVRRPVIRVAFVLSCLFATFLWNYLRAQSGEIFQVLFFAGFFRAHQRLQKTHGSLRSWLAPWFWIAALTLSRLSYGLLVPIYAIALLVWSPDAEERLRDRARRVAVPVTAIVALVMVVNFVKFGAAFHGGYDQWHPDWHRPASLAGVLGFLVDPQRSIFTHFPLLFPALLGWPAFFRRYRVDAILLVTIFVAFLLALGSLPSWRGEWSYGPRYLCFLLPFVSLPAATWGEELLSNGRRPLQIAALAVLIPLLLWSTVMQWEVNRLQFFAYYKLDGWVLQQEYVESHAYFERRTFGQVNLDLIRTSPEYERLPYVREFAALHDHTVEQDLEYLRSIRGVRDRLNLYWWSEPIADTPSR